MTTSYQPQVGGAHRTGYIKTLIKSKDFIKDLEKMEFLSTVLTNPDLTYYSKALADNDDDAKLQRYRYILEKNKEKPKNFVSKRLVNFLEKDKQ